LPLPPSAFASSPVGLFPQSPLALPPAILVLAGPTAVGKTDLSLSLAQQLDAEIVSADSRQVYRELTIGTAKPPPDELAIAPHHFIDELHLGEPFSAGIFAREATDRIHDIHGRGRTALVTGGSTLYLEALLHGLSGVPETSAETRGELTERLRIEGAENLFAELERVDPVSAATMDPTKTQRLVRALEVYHDTGEPLSHYHREAQPPPFRSLVFVLTRPRERLYQRINQRVDVMLEAGLVDENRRLLDAGFPPDLNPLRTIGYREPMAHLRGEIDFEEMMRRLKRNTRRYAKRQLTWFRRRPEYVWIDLDEEGLGATTGILERWSGFLDAGT
jgi:tRNA dimethylallyltransferase